MSSRGLRRSARVLLDARRATDDDWSRVRSMAALGGSEAAAAVGESEWDSAYTVWLRKRGLLARKPQTERMRWGLRLEPLILRAFAEETGFRVVRQHTLLQSVEHPFMVARLDALAYGGDDGPAVVDAKATRGWGDDGPSPDAWWQVQHYLVVTGLRVGWLAVLEQGSRLRPVRVEADPAAAAALVELESRLARHIADGTEPPIDGTEATRLALQELHDEREGARELDAAALELVRRRQTLTAGIEVLEAQRELVENQLRGWLGEAGEGTLMGEWLVRYRARRTTQLDQRLLRERHPKLAARYSRVVETRPLTFRR